MPLLSQVSLRLLLTSLFLLTLFVASVDRLDARVVVGVFREDFRSSSPLISGWQYLWNSPAGWSVGSSGDLKSGSIAARSAYRPLVSNGEFWTADGDSAGGNNDPSGFIRISDTGGHVGQSAAAAGERDRYAIVAYTVDADGLYAIENSYVNMVTESGDGVELLVFPGESEAILRRTVTSVSSSDFDLEIGFLSAGQTIYVAVGPSGNASFDSFEYDFEIVRYPRNSIRVQIENALSAGADSVIVEAGRYYYSGPGRHVSLSGINRTDGFEIIAEGVTLICQTPNRVLEFNECLGLSVRGLTIDYDPLLYRQGTIVARGNQSVDLQLHEGYPENLTPEATSGIAYDASTLDMLAGTQTIYPDLVSELSPGLYRIFSSQIEERLQVGAYISFTEPTGVPHAIYMESCQDVELVDVEIRGSPAFAFLSRKGRSIRLENVRVLPGPTPLRGSIPRLLSSNADGIHFKSSVGNLTVSNCRLSHTGDDSIVLTAAYDPVIEQAASDRIVLAPKAPTDYSIGEVLQFSNPRTGRIESAIVEGVVPLATDRAAIIDSVQTYFPDAIVSSSNFAQAYELQLDRVISSSAGALASRPDFAHSGFRIIGCEIDNSRARGIQVKGRQGVISGNRIRNTFLAGIQVRPDAQFWLEGDFSQSLRIEENILTDCGIGSRNAVASIYVGSRGFENLPPLNGHRDISIMRNEVSKAPGSSLFVGKASGVGIRSNRFVESHQVIWDPQSWSSSVVWLEHVDDILVNGLNLAMSPDEDNVDSESLLGLGDVVSNLQSPAILFLDTDGDGLTDIWESRYSDSVTGLDAGADYDSDGLAVHEEFMANLDPYQADAFELKIDRCGLLSWDPIPHRFFTLRSSSSLDQDFEIIAPDLAGGTDSFPVDLEGISRSVFYRLSVHD